MARTLQSAAGATYEDVRHILDQEIRRFMRRYGVTYPNGSKNAGPISVQYGMRGVPETYFIAPDGRLIRKWNTLPADVRGRTEAVQVVREIPSLQRAHRASVRVQLQDLRGHSPPSVA